MKFTLLVACLLGVTLYVPHHMISAIYVPPEMMPAGAPAESTNNADAQTRSLGGAARTSIKQDVPRLSSGAEVNPPVVNLPDPAAPVAAADPVIVLPAAPAVPAAPALPVAPANPSGAEVVVTFGDDDDDDDDD